MEETETEAMRFSLKWLLAATAYAAVACASVVYAGEGWESAIAALTFATIAGSVTGAVLQSGRSRVLFLGYAVTSIGLAFAVLGGLEWDSPFPSTMRRVVHAMADQIPNIESAARAEFMKMNEESGYQAPVTMIDSVECYRFDGDECQCTAEYGSARTAFPVPVVSSGIPLRIGLSAILTYHLILLFSLLGGLLGLWFWKREEGAKAP